MATIMLVIAQTDRETSLLHWVYNHTHTHTIQANRDDRKIGEIFFKIDVVENLSFFGQKISKFESFQPHLEMNMMINGWLYK